MYVLDGKKLRQGRPFTHNGIQYPGNWLKNLTSADEKSAIGITWEADPAPFDHRFYVSAGVAKNGCFCYKNKYDERARLCCV